MENWKDIPGYDGLYQASNLGRVKSSKGFFYKGTPDKDGYMRVALIKDRKAKTLRIHRLICFAFLPNPENKPQVNHKNGIRTDNRIENLEWCTAKENTIHSVLVLNRVATWQGKFGESNYFSKKIQCIESGIVYGGISEASRTLGISNTHLSNVCLGKKKTAKGLTFKYA